MCTDGATSIIVIIIQPSVNRRKISNSQRIADPAFLGWQKPASGNIIAVYWKRIPFCSLKQSLLLLFRFSFHDSDHFSYLAPLQNVYIGQRTYTIPAAFETKTCFFWCSLTGRHILFTDPAPPPSPCVLGYVSFWKVCFQKPATQSELPRGWMSMWHILNSFPILDNTLKYLWRETRLLLNQTLTSFTKGRFNR